jgi:hypothetical protein
MLAASCAMAVLVYRSVFLLVLSATLVTIITASWCLLLLMQSSLIASYLPFPVVVVFVSRSLLLLLVVDVVVVVVVLVDGLAVMLVPGVPKVTQC